jgi:opacity protein-like surface antigen
LFSFPAVGLLLIPLMMNAIKKIRVQTMLFATAMLVAGSAAAAAQDKPVEVIVYPILVEAPLFGASLDLPSIPGGGGSGGGGGGAEGGDQSGKTDVSLNTLYMAGLSVRANRWFAEARGQWADLSASRATPRVTLDTRARFFTARGGVTLFKGLSVTGGVRRIWGELDASLSPPILGDKVLSGSVDKTLYDPLVGADWRGRAGKFIFEANFQAGGFGVGADRDVSSEFDVNWRFTPHTDIRLGWGFFNYKISTDPISIGSFQRTLVSSQTLNGPTVGFGIVF